MIIVTAYSLLCNLSKWCQVVSRQLLTAEAWVHLCGSFGEQSDTGTGLS